MHFGFSYVGLIYLAMLFIPNLCWTKHRPEGYEQYAEKENKILRLFERVGEVLVTAAVLIFSDFNLRCFSFRTAWLMVSFVLMCLYEVCWIRYFKSEKMMGDMYRNFMGIPVPLATLPVTAFFLLGVYGKNPFLMIAAVILGIGHIGIHRMHRKEMG